MRAKNTQQKNKQAKYQIRQKIHVPRAAESSKFYIHFLNLYICVWGKCKISSYDFSDLQLAFYSVLNFFWHVFYIRDCLSLRF